MSAAPSNGERPPLQGGFRRSFTLPARQLSFHEKAGLDKADANENILYTHPAARIISFSPPTISIKSTSKAEIPADTDYPVDTVETLPWRSRTETLAAAGQMLIEKVRGSTNFLKCQEVMHAILRNSQCWCVDGESKFVLRVRKFQYYRIELPSSTDQDKAKVEELKKVFPTVLRYERTPCPFIRAFTVDLPDDAITPRRKGPWKRRDSSQPNTPDTDTPPLRRTKPTRSWSMKNPPSSYPRGGPGYANEGERGRPGSASGFHRRGSLFDEYRNSSPASVGQSDEGTDSEHQGSEHDSELDSTTDRSETASPRKHLETEGGKRSALEESSIDLDSELDTGGIAAEAGSSTLPSTRAKLDGRSRMGLHDDQSPSEAVTYRENPNTIPSLSTSSATPLIASVVAKRAAALEQRVTNTEDAYNYSKPLQEKRRFEQHNLDISQRSSDSSFEIDTSLNADTTEEKTGKSLIDSNYEVDKENENQALGQDAAVIDTGDLPSVDGALECEIPSPPEQEKNVYSATTSANSSPARLLSPSPRTDQPASELIESSSELESTKVSLDESESETALAMDSAVGNEILASYEPTAQDIVTDQEISSVPGLDTNQHASPLVEVDIAGQDRLSRLALDTELGQNGEDKDDDLSSPSSMDSFHTMASVARRVSQSRDTDFTDISNADWRNELQAVSRHKREISEMTITASSISDPASPEQSRPHQQDDEQTQTPSLLRSSASDSSWPEPATPSSAMQDREGLRQRLKSRRSFSPLPPPSTIFNGNEIRHDSGSGHMTKVILQKVIIKPIEVAVFIVHILARIASGATVNDLLSGELFRKPEHRRTVSGFADQSSNSRDGSDTEDDFGVPIRGRTRSTERRVATVLDGEGHDNLEDVD